IRLLHLLTVPFSAHVFPTSLSFYCLFFFSMLPPLPIYPLFPYTTLFRSLPRTYISSSDLPHGRVRSPIPGSGAFDQISRARVPRSEEHTSELQSRFDLVCRLLLEKKKNRKLHTHMTEEDTISIYM